MPRFAANLQWLFTERPFLERFAAARAAGFRGVEFPSPYEQPAAAIAAQLAAHGLECVLFNLPMGDRARGDFGIACRPGREAEFRDGVGRALEYAAALGARRLNCVAGTAAAGEDREALAATLAGNLRFAASACAAAGVALVMEPINDRDVPGFLVPRCADAARLIAQAGAPNLGLQCDLYHVAMMGDDGGEALRAHRAIVRHVQFADAPGRGEPGSGALPLAALFRAIDASGYDGWVSAEYRPSRRTEDTLAWMSEFS